MAKRLLSLLISGILLATVTPAFANLPQQVAGQKLPSLSPVLERSMPAVVNIYGKGRVQRHLDPFARPPEERGIDEDDNPRGKPIRAVGSGVIVDAQNGYIITNAHVITQVKTITVTLNDGRKFDADVVGKDVQSDLAVLQIKASGLKAIPFADSSQLNVGDFVVAIGSPFGLNQSVTSGIISALQRTDIGIEGYENFIQTDAPINPGNSGGALVNLKGELVGINTAILASGGGSIGIGFAIPSNMAKNVMHQLVKYGELKRGVAGIMIQSMTPELAQAFKEPNAKGAIITQVSPNSPAQAAGLRPGDVIQSVNGETIKTAGQVKNTIGLLRAGSTMDLKVLRDGKTVALKLTTVESKQYKVSSIAKNPFLYGMILKDFDAEVPNYGEVKGVQVLKSEDNTPAGRAGLRQGDIIMSVDRHPVTNMKQLETLTHKKSPEVLLSVFRGNGAIYVVVKK
ncbi:MAG: hypothetical protein CMF50_04090 [Legionellales bacterium]|nr:hypothetical protein [Legionellales bacterium]